MKAIVIICLFSVTCYSQAQNYESYHLTFEDTAHYGKLFIDTISYPDNIWQIGSPQKNILNEAFSPPNVIVTDTINPYPVNDTSIFKVIHRVNIALAHEQRMELSGHYKVDCDSLEDFGMIEYSPDNGITWLDMINDQPFVWDSQKPVLTGLSDWTYFYVSFNDLGYDLEFGDTVQFRFIFMSDSIQNNRGGLMFDDLLFNDFFEGVDSRIYGEFNSLVYPNPTVKWLTIEFDNKYLSLVNLEIMDAAGKLISNFSGGQKGYFEIDISSFRPGSYFYRLVDPLSYKASHGKFIVK